MIRALELELEALEEAERAEQDAAADRRETRRLSTPGRAPRLRMVAGIVDEQADSVRFPAAARALACKMRLRASALEAGSEAENDRERETWQVRGESDDRGQ